MISNIIMTLYNSRLPGGSCVGKVCVCVSVRPSRPWILSKRINIYSIFFTVGYSYTILVFPYQTSLQYSDWDPVTGASNAGEVWQK